jgi:hypothetical protein
MTNYRQLPSTQVQIEVAGQAYIGSYEVDGDVVTAQWNGWSDSTQAGASGAEAIAKQLVRELVRKHRDMA